MTDTRNHWSTSRDFLSTAWGTGPLSFSLGYASSTSQTVPVYSLEFGAKVLPVQCNSISVLRNYLPHSFPLHQFHSWCQEQGSKCQVDGMTSLAKRRDPSHFSRTLPHLLTSSLTAGNKWPKPCFVVHLRRFEACRGLTNTGSPALA